MDMETSLFQTNYTQKSDSRISVVFNNSSQFMNRQIPKRHGQGTHLVLATHRHQQSLMKNLYRLQLRDMYESCRIAIDLAQNAGLFHSQSQMDRFLSEVSTNLHQAAKQDMNEFLRIASILDDEPSSRKEIQTRLEQMRKEKKLCKQGNLGMEPQELRQAPESRHVGTIPPLYQNQPRHLSPRNLQPEQMEFRNLQISRPVTPIYRTYNYGTPQAIRNNISPGNQPSFFSAKKSNQPVDLSKPSSQAIVGDQQRLQRQSSQKRPNVEYFPPTFSFGSDMNAPRKDQ